MNTGIYGYRISGLAVLAEILLPGVTPFGVEPGGEDAVIRRRPVPDHLDNPALCGPAWELDEERILLKITGVGRFLAWGGRVLEMEPEPGVDCAYAMPFLLGSGFGALLLQRGDLVLHAAAVADGGRSYVFCGRRGAGKSTLAAAMCGIGCGFVADDVCAIDLDDQQKPLVGTDGRYLKLLPESIDQLALAGSIRGAVAGTDKYYVEPPCATAESELPVAAVYILANDEVKGAPLYESLLVPRSAQAILNHSYRLRLALAMARFGRQMSITASLLNHVPVFHLNRSRDMSRIKETAASLRAHWRSLLADKNAGIATGQFRAISQ